MNSPGQQVYNMLQEKGGEMIPERIKTRSPVVDVTGDESKVRCCKEQ